MKPQLYIHSLDYFSDITRYFSAIKDLRYPIWLDSGVASENGSQRHILAAEPSATLVVRNGITYWQDGEQKGQAELAFPLDKAKQLLPQQLAPSDDCVFPGGWLGYLSYDLARLWMRLASRQSDLSIPDAMLGRYDWVLLVDQSKQLAQLVAYMDEDSFNQLKQRISRLLDESAGIANLPTAGQDLQLQTSKPQYLEALRKVFSYIHEGDCYQVNYAQRFDARTKVSAAPLYCSMRQQNPAPYGAYFDFDGMQLMSFSPEKFLTLQQGRVTTKPIKGTRPRYTDTLQDNAAKQALSESAKDRAENLMIVDLLRNDLGKVCEPGSIAVPKLFEIESFATVHHLVSTVSGQLAEGKDAADLLKACFPGGSITGAPKLRAMQIIDELEPVRRDAYCGCFLRWGYDGNLDSSISIRTLLKRNEQLHYWAGGGIVADSDAEDEYQESLAKAAAFLNSLGLSVEEP